MKEYYFLFALALIWTLFASLHDIKKREVANWLNFSLIAFALSYRALYSISIKNYQFLFLGLAGLVIFTILAHLFYYGRIFAGGDAKLLIAFGTILPFTNYSSLISISIIFLFLLFALGAIYSMLLTIFIAAKNKNKFKKEFRKKTKNKLFDASIIVLIISLIYSIKDPLALTISLISLIIPLYAYIKSVDKCMLVLLPSNKITEGDWLEKDIKINSKITIKKTVHGLSKKDIEILRRHNKKVLIKQGIPFVPAFLLALTLTLFFFLTSRLSLVYLLSFLS